MKRFLAIFSIAMSLITSPALVYAAPIEGGAGPVPKVASSAGKDDACAALQQVDPTKKCGTGAASIGGLVKSIVTLLSTVVGIAAVIMIIISGFKYVTSGGDSGNIASAKTTLVYALVGLVIAALAQVLVKFVLNTAG